MIVEKTIVEKTLGVEIVQPVQTPAVRASCNNHSSNKKSEPKAKTNHVPELTLQQRRSKSIELEG
jgi:hypothetical protein